jgi:hypothetical protein
MTRMTKASSSLKILDKTETQSRRRMRATKTRNSMNKIKARSKKPRRKRTKSSILGGPRWTSSRKELEIFS